METIANVFFKHFLISFINTMFFFWLRRFFISSWAS